MTNRGIDPEDLEQIADLECPDCGPMVDDEGEFIGQAYDVDTVIGENQCPDCGGELEPTMEASLDMLRMVAERIPGMRDAIAASLAAALGAES